MKKKFHKKLFWIGMPVCVAVGVAFASAASVESDGWRLPDYEKKDISMILNKAQQTASSVEYDGKVEFSEALSAEEWWTEERRNRTEESAGLSPADYEELFLQTGIGRPVAEELVKTPEGRELLLACQKNLFENKRIKCRRIGVITDEEKFYSSAGNIEAGFDIVSIREGDIFITFSTHSLGWRHGHAAIVVNSQPLQTLEAEVLGSPSRIVKNARWNKYTTFVQLRLKEEYGGAQTAGAAGSFACKDLVGIEYGLLCDKENVDIEKCQCAFVVWRAYKEAGLDIDGNGGSMVFPADLCESPYFDIIQAFGLDLTAKQ